MSGKPILIRFAGSPPASRPADVEVLRPQRLIWAVTRTLAGALSLMPPARSLSVQVTVLLLIARNLLNRLPRQHK